VGLSEGRGAQDETEVWSMSQVLEGLKAGDISFLEQSPRGVEACHRQGVEPKDLIFQPLESFMGTENAQQMRFESHEKQRQEWVRAVAREYRSAAKPSRKQGQGSNRSRSQASSSRSFAATAVAAREAKALENFEKVLSTAVETSLENVRKAAEVEAAQAERNARLESMQRKLYEDKRDEAVCKDAWRKSKYDTAKRVAAFQLEHHAGNVIEKEHVRLRALKDREARYNSKTEVRRAEHQRRAQSVATTLLEQQQLRATREQNNDQQDQLRNEAYMRGMEKQREHFAMRGKQKNIEINSKRNRVREMEDAKVRNIMKKSTDKMSQFLHNQLEKQRREEMVQMMKRSEAEKDLQKKQFVLDQAEKRKSELLKRLSGEEEMLQRAAAKKADQDALRAEKHTIRQEEINKSKERMRKMEDYRMEKLMEHVQAEDERIKNIQDEKQREMELVRRIKRASHLKQKEIKEKLARRQQSKLKEVAESAAGSVLGSPNSAINNEELTFARKEQVAQQSVQNRGAYTEVTSEASVTHDALTSPTVAAEEEYDDDFAPESSPEPPMAPSPDPPSPDVEYADDFVGDDDN